MSNKFENVREDEDTTIHTSIEATFGEYSVLHQTWSWGGIKAESLIFCTEDIKHLTEDELISDVHSSALTKPDSVVSDITYKQSEDFTFVSFNFNYDGCVDGDDIFDSFDRIIWMKSMRLEELRNYSFLTLILLAIYMAIQQS